MIAFASPGARRLARASATALCALAGGTVARADTPRNTPAAIEVDRDSVPAGRVGFGFDGGEPVDAWGVSSAVGWIERPIELKAGAFGAATPASRPVRRRQTLTLGGALALGDRLVLDAAVRGSHQIGDRLHAAGDPAALARYVFHDLRIGGRIRFAGDRDRAALLRVDLALPSGNADQLAGDARSTLAWQLIGRATLPRRVVIAGSAGVRFHRAEIAVGDQLVGDELFAAAGVAVPVSAAGELGAERMVVTAELHGAYGDHVGKLAGPSPLEAQIGLIGRPLAAFAIGTRIGVGLDDAIGAPSIRAVLELAWTPRIAVADRPAPAPPPPQDDEPDDDATR